MVDLVRARDLARQLNDALADTTTPAPTPAPPPPSAIFRVKPGDNLQAALDTAPAGTAILAQPGIYPGLVLKPRTGKVTLQADTANLPAAGVRIDPSYAPACVQLQATVNGAALGTQGPANDYEFVGVQLLPGTDPGHEMASLGTDTEARAANAPVNIRFDRCLVLANQTKGGKRGIMANMRRLDVVGCHLDNFFYSADSQGLAGWNGPGPFLVDNCFIAASGENVLFGGGDSVSQEMQPNSLTLRRSLLTKRPGWKTAGGVTVKNALELKNLIGAVIENNVFEYSWRSGQAGYLVVFTPRNQGGTAPYSQVAGVVFDSNVVRHGGAGFQVAGDDDEQPSARTTSVRISNNVIYDIDGANGDGRIFQVTRGPVDVELAHNTVQGKNLSTFLQLSDTPALRLVVRDNILPEGAYGIMGDGDTGPGAPSWAARTTGSTFNRNLIQRQAADAVPYTGTGNLVTPAGAAVVGPDLVPVAKYAAFATTDGKAIGAAVTSVLAACGTTV